MPEFKVDITAAISNVITVNADTEEQAEEKAHEVFSLMYAGLQIYDQNTYDIIDESMLLYGEKSS